jgi:hypothetical protein
VGVGDVYDRPSKAGSPGASRERGETFKEGDGVAEHSGAQRWRSTKGRVLCAVVTSALAASVGVVPGRVGASGTTTPPEVVVLGDSTALTLGYAVAATAPPGTQVVNGGLFGCGLAVATASSANPPQGALSMAPACNSSTPPDQRWPALDARAVAFAGPGDQVIFWAGAWDTQDLLVNGQWTSILSSSFRTYLFAQMRRLVRIATSHGAHLDVLTMPSMDPGYQFHKPPGQTYSKGRRLLFNGLLVRAARRYPGRVSVINFGRTLCPDGRFTLYVNGVQVRALDGIHTPAYVPGNIFANNASKSVAHKFDVWLRPRLWPRIISPPSG